MTVFYWPRMEPDGGGVKTTAPAATQGLRIGFTVGRALGGAVQRNRMKRRLREAVRLTRMPSVSADVVINPKKSLLTVDFAAIVNEAGRAFVVIEEKLQKLAANAGPTQAERNGQINSAHRKPGA